MKPVKSVKLRNQVLDELMEEIGKIQAGDNRLPNEEELAKALKVSRATIREALNVLTNGGFVTRRQGKGNFAHPSAKKMHHRIDLTGDFHQLLGTKEEPAVCEVLRWGYSQVPAAMQEIFPFVQHRVFEQYWLYRVGALPMILCKIYVPEELLVKQPHPPANSDPLFQWLSEYCNKDTSHYSVHLDCGIDKDANWILGVDNGTALQNWQEIVYDIFDFPIAFCDLFFHPTNVELSMILQF